MKQLAVASIVVFASVVLIAAAPAVVPVSITRLVVQDATSAQPLPGALVEWHVDQQVMRGSSDASGRFAFEIPARSGQSRTVRISVRVNGYIARSVSLQTAGGTQPAITIKLVRSTHFASVHGTVVNSDTRRGIANVQVALLIDGFPQNGLQTRSDRNGRYTIRHVAYASDLILSAHIPSIHCDEPVVRTVSIDRPMLTQNVSLSPRTGSTCAPLTGHGPPINTKEQTPLPDPTSNPASLRTDPSILWRPTTRNAIFGGASENIWNAGHINDIVKTGPNSALVGSDTGGVWSIAWSSSSAAALSLSQSWDAVSISALARGADGNNDFYAGTYGNDRGGGPGGVLWETDTSTALPIQNWRHVTATKCGKINEILVIPRVRRIVIACDSGLWWSSIPAHPAAQNLYQWKAATAAAGTTLPGAVSGVVLGPGWARTANRGGSIAAIAYGATSTSMLIYTGRWLTGQLVLTASSVKIGAGQSAQFGRASIASCAKTRARMYAMADDGNDQNLAAVWVSNNGGGTWTLEHLPPNVSPPAATGGQGWYDQALAVSPADCNTFALGWTYSTFVSFDAGNSYPVALNGADSGCTSICNLHDDYHVALFDPYHPSTLWLGSDGGLSSVAGVIKGGNPTFASYYNEHIDNLQMYHATPSFHSTVQLPNLVASPLQDNAVVWGTVNSPWDRLPGSSGDGAYAEFSGAAPAPLDVLAVQIHADIMRQSTWKNGQNWSGLAAIPVTDGVNPRDPAGVSTLQPARVRSPSYMNAAGETMYEVAGSGNTVYGLFANTTGGDLHWENLGSIGTAENVNAVSSWNGNMIVVGTDKGNICTLQAPYTGPWPCINQIIAAPNGLMSAQINGVDAAFSSIAFAVGKYSDGSGAVLKFDGSSWQPISANLPTNLPFMSVDGYGLLKLFVTNGQQVFVTHDMGASWLNASNGLPSQPLALELQYAVEPNGHASMFLSTYGWSMYYTPI